MLINEVYNISPQTEKYGYCAVRPDFKSAAHISNLLMSIGLDSVILPRDLHCTLMYDTKNELSYEKMVEICAPTNVYDDVEFIDISILGNAIVIKFESQMLQDRHTLLKNYMTHSYDSLLLHMSIKYFDDGVSGEDIKKELETILKYKKEIKDIFSEIHFTGEYFEELS